MKRNINEVILKFKSDQQDIQHRYYSFDFCYRQIELKDIKIRWLIEKLQ